MLCLQNKVSMLFMAHMSPDLPLRSSIGSLQAFLQMCSKSLVRAQALQTH